MILPTDFDFTQGKLQDYVDCPYRFYLRYVLHIKWPALIVDDAHEFELRGQTGGRFHRLIQQYLLGIPQERINALADDDPNPDLHDWWEGFLTYVPPWLEGQHWVETTLACSLAGQRLVAKYDLILADEHGLLTIFDWKTSQKSPRVDWLSERIQTRLYRLVLNLAGSTLTGGEFVDPEQITMNYWFATSPQSAVSLPYSRSAYERDRSDLAHLVSEIRSSDPGSFTRTSDIKQCRYCVYRSHCDRGVEAGDLLDFDDFGSQPGESEAFPEFEDLPEIEF